MPAANSVRIPGPTNIMIVLIDCISSTSPSSIVLPGGTNDTSPRIPVYRNPANAANQATNITANWLAYWSTANLPHITSNCASVFNELCNLLAVDDACGTAISLASEAMLVNFPGIGMTPDLAGIGYAGTPHGSWSWGATEYDEAGGPIDEKNGVIQSTNWRRFWVDDNEEVRKKLIGFNFSAITPLHQQTTGATKVNYNLFKCFY